MVNQTTKGNQRNASIAMDADGDFVVVWESPNQETDGSGNLEGSWGVYARRFDAMGRPLTGEFHVNTITQGQQWNPAVAMNDTGSFVVVWDSTVGQTYSYYHNIKAQIFNADGTRSGGEIRINSQNIPSSTGPATNGSAGNSEVNPAVAMTNTGSFVVVWDMFTGQYNSVGRDSIVVGRMFDTKGNPISHWVPSDTQGGTPASSNLEFQVDASPTTIGSNHPDFVSDPYHIDHQLPVDQIGVLPITGKPRRNPSIAMDRNGNFAVSWESFQDNDIWDDPPHPAGDYPTVTATDWPESFGIYFRALCFPRFAADYRHHQRHRNRITAGTAATNINGQQGDINANLVLTGTDAQSRTSAAINSTPPSPWTPTAMSP